jgi:hypothetical protein
VYYLPWRRDTHTYTDPLCRPQWQDSGNETPNITYVIIVIIIIVIIIPEYKRSALSLLGYTSRNVERDMAKTRKEKSSLCQSRSSSKKKKLLDIIPFRMKWCVCVCVCVVHCSCFATSSRSGSSCLHVSHNILFLLLVLNNDKFDIL